MQFTEGEVKNARHSNYPKTVGSDKERRTIDVHKVIFEIQNTSLQFENDHNPIPISNADDIRVVHAAGRVSWYNNLSNGRRHVPRPFFSLFISVIFVALTVYSFFPMPLKWPTITASGMTFSVAWIARAIFAMISLTTYFSYKADRRKLRFLTLGELPD